MWFFFYFSCTVSKNAHKIPQHGHSLEFWTKPLFSEVVFLNKDALLHTNDNDGMTFNFRAKHSEKYSQSLQNNILSDMLFICMQHCF